MSVSGCPGEVGQMPDITVRPPSSVNNLLDLYRAQQLALILRCQARLYGAMQFTHVALTHRCIKNAGRHLDDDNAGDNPGMRSNACAQPFIGLNFLDEHPAQRTLLRGIAHVLISIATSLTLRSSCWRCGWLKAPVGTLIRIFGMAKPRG